MSKRTAACLVAVLLAGGTVPADAARTRTFRTDSYESFRRGETEGVALNEDGQVFLAPSLTRLADPGVRTVWAMARGRDQRLVLATGDQGQVVSVDAGEKTPEPKVLASLFDYELFALAAAPNGSFYAAGAPVGTVTRIRPDGSTETLFDVPEGIVFALLVGEDGTVYAATGDRGRLYKISPDGSSRVLVESPDVVLRSLAWGKGGKIWAGTDGRGLVEEISPSSGAVRVLYDAAEEEIVSLAPLPDGGLVFAANPGVGAGGQGASPSDSGGNDTGGGSGGSGEARGPSPMVYRMEPDGSVRRLWACPERILHAVVARDDGSILAATGQEGAVYRIDPLGRETLLWRAEEEQVLSLLLTDGGVFAGTGNPGRLYRLGPATEDEGTLTSRVFDARDQAAWGLLHWERTGGGTIAFETRSGYTDPPDESWSPWSAATATAPGGAPYSREAMAASPPARFLQWRATLRREKGAVPLLERVSAAYAGINRPPRIASLRLSPQTPFYTAADGGRSVTQLLPGGIQIDYSIPTAAPVTVPADDVPTWIRSIRSVVWDAHDADGDDLAYRLEIRAVGDTEWRLLAADVRDRGFSFDQGLLPDGPYELRLVASDAPSNPVGSARTDERTTPVFNIDTIAPVVEGVKVRRLPAGTGKESEAEGGRGSLEVTGTAVDESSPIARIEASVDGEEFRWLAPDDGLLDGRREVFTGRVPLEAGRPSAWIVVRVQDEAGNRGTYRAWLDEE